MGKYNNQIINFHEWSIHVEKITDAYKAYMDFRLMKVYK